MPAARQPAPRRAGAELPGGRVPGAPPPGGDAAQPHRGHVEGGGQQVIRRAAVLAAQHQPVNVALLDLDRCRPGGCRRHRCPLLSPWWMPRRARPPARFAADSARPARRGSRRAAGRKQTVITRTRAPLSPRTPLTPHFTVPCPAGSLS